MKYAGEMGPSDMIYSQSFMKLVQAFKSERAGGGHNMVIVYAVYFLK
jgi:hypothetical protein